jgi:hypothetical protein
VAREDELEPLRRAWDELAVPAAPREDAAERAAVDWMRGAWARIEPPAGASLPRRSARGASRRRPRWAWLAAAAAAGLAAVLLGLAQLGERRDARPRSTEVPVAGAPPRSGPGLPAEPESIPIATLTADRMELRAGNVRLILLTQHTGRPERP